MQDNKKCEDTLTLAIFYLFLLCICIQTFYYLYYFSGLIFYNDKKNPKNVHEKSVSLVICAHNEYNNLINLIPCLLSQKYTNFEIIIVNDRSDDKTRKLETQFSQSNIRFLHITQTPKGYNPKKFALTKGIEAAVNDIILLTDADCTPRSDEWIRRMTEEISEEISIVLGYSQYRTKKGLLNKLIRYETLFTGIQYLSAAIKGKPYMGVGRNMSYLKSLFINNNGLESHKELTGGDDDLFIRDVASTKNIAIRIDSKSQTLSIPKETWKEWLKQKRRHLSAGKKYRFKAKLWVGLLNISNILFYLSFFTLLFSYVNALIIIILLVLRTVLIITIFAFISKKLEEKLKWYWLPILDFLYVTNYVIVGTAALFATKIKWN